MNSQDQKDEKRPERKLACKGSEEKGRASVKRSKRCLLFLLLWCAVAAVPDNVRKPRASLFWPPAPLSALALAPSLLLLAGFPRLPSSPQPLFPTFHPPSLSGLLRHHLRLEQTQSTGLSGGWSRRLLACTEPGPPTIASPRQHLDIDATPLLPQPLSLDSAPRPTLLRPRRLRLPPS